MTLDETKRVLAAIAIYEYRFGKPDENVLKGWHKVLADLDVDDAVQAVLRYYADNTERIMPAHIRSGVKAIRAERRRLQPSAPRALPSRFEDDINREVCMERGAASTREVLERLLGHIGASRPELPSAMDELRALTAGPSVVDAEIVDDEVQS
ncbi:hypothetical protein [Verrucosispora sp. NA02020]|uniref:hypothetical protein n=1 Tax=Verrucosispora sp. NA02020 TaxID=2742132 RepID=UPI0015917E31|nr:hypothetical protein [Verrucosispora sp. NA02020]QKW15349.1 hypothetical protein HUT12_23020 [Verrucosispora sp. NA02020]